MRKALVAMGGVFAVAFCLLGLFPGVLGPFTEAMTMALVGLGLYGCSALIGHRWSAVPAQSPVKT